MDGANFIIQSGNDVDAVHEARIEADTDEEATHDDVDDLTLLNRNFRYQIG